MVTLMTEPRQSRYGRLSRVQPVSDPTERPPWSRLLPLVAAETLGIGVLLLVYSLTSGDDPLSSAILLPVIVTFALVFATANSPASRPGRVLAAYALAGIIGLAAAAVPGPTLPMAIIGTGITLLAMHLTGTFHAPAIAVTITAEIADPSWQQALIALPLLLVFAAIAIGLVWMTHRLIGQHDYPEKWW